MGLYRETHPFKNNWKSFEKVYGRGIIQHCYFFWTIMLPLIAGNWKMNGSPQTVVQLLSDLKSGSERIPAGIAVAVFPSFVFLPDCERILSGSRISWGAQNVSEETNGAYTGEVAASMLKDFGCRYALVGHSERRCYYGETNAVVAKKCARLWEVGMIPVVCVGENANERDKGETERIIVEQLDAVGQIADNLPKQESLVVAYEPLWAIGTGRAADPKTVDQVHNFIRKKLRELFPQVGDSVRILYGGSVNSKNSASLLAIPEVGGVLVGGASLQATEFLAIGQLCKP